MPEGGPRPSAGRKQAYRYFINGKEYQSDTEAAKAQGVAKQTIHNWCKSKNKPDCRKEPVNPKKKKPAPLSNESGDIPDDIKDAAAKENKSPLDYMLDIMNNENKDEEVRIRCGYYALPYCHAKVAAGKKGKKDERQEKANKAGGGKFQSGKPPLRSVK